MTMKKFPSLEESSLPWSANTLLHGLTQGDLKMFYEELNNDINAVPNADKLIIFGNFNVKVRRETTTWEA